MKIPCTNVRHFKWRGISFNPEGRRSTSFQCDLCNDMIKEYDTDIMSALQMHDTRKHGKQAKQEAASAAPSR